MTGGAQAFSGVGYLALDGDRFRLEIVDKTGTVALAVAGSPAGSIRLDPATGQRTAIEGNALTVPGRFRVSASMIRTLVTGEAPAFGRVRATGVSDGLRVARVEDPRMALWYAGRLERVTHFAGAGAAVDIYLGEMAQGPAAPYVSRAELVHDNVRIVIEWTDVRQGMAFPEGFFEFDEPS